MGSMLGLLRRWFRPEGLPPLLVRVRNREGFVEGAIQLRATWQPSGRTSTTMSRAAQGLCIIPWAGGKGVDIEVMHETGTAKLRAIADDARAGEAQLVWLS
jgi:hypothetical protein